MLVLSENNQDTKPIPQTLDSPSQIIFQKAQELNIRCYKVPTKKGGYKARYIRLNGKFCYALVNRNPTSYHPSTNRRYFHFTISKKAIDRVNLVILITVSETREDVYIFEKSEIDNFEGEAHHYYVPDVSCTQKRRPRNLPTILKYNQSLNNWDKILTAA